MSRKTFKDKTNYLDRFFSEEPQKTPGTDGTQNTHVMPKHYRINLKLKAEYKAYLDQVSWESRKSITQYLNDLIEADKVAKDR